MERINVLQILAGAREYNGVSDFLLSHYMYMDREKIHFDFLFCRENTLTSRQEEEFLSGSDYIELKVKFSSLPGSLKLIRRVSEVLKRGNYDIVHINTGSIYITACCVIAAGLAKASCIISHSHNTDPRNIRKRSRMKEAVLSCGNSVMRRLIRKRSSALFACSDEAGVYLFGKRGLRSDKYRQMKNAIHTDDFLFHEDVRKTVRREYGAEDDTTVLGCVGRFSQQKNHSFLIDVFLAYAQRNPKSRLWLVGDGPTRAAAERKVSALGLTDSVRFFGQRRDVNRLLQGFDGFVLTSFFEGLGTVSIEAQAAGLRVFLPDEISHGSGISDLAHFIPLSAGAEFWAGFIDETMREPFERKNMHDAILESGYDIAHAAKILENLYIGLVNG